MPVFFVSADQIRDKTATITGPLLTHLRSSLRVQVGERLRLTDPQRRRLMIEVTSVDCNHLLGQVLSAEAGPSPQAPRIILGQALLKGEHMDWVIQKATELGVDTVVPLISQHVIVRPREARIPSQVERWQRIALEAAQQSERWDVPTIATPCNFSQWLETESIAACRLIMLERGGQQALQTIPFPSSSQEHIVIVIGPEGGWREEEGAEALAKGFLPVRLGQRILRAETAALAALSVIQSRLGELG
ncbi:MAG: 16S rRNA (uracil(1498)-N(3))-methyltransferase [Nitrospirae bacterium]|nr:16S rRNA (uracil(1498)-N(3))-methyltransferase [Nitrospirota bacterium]